MLAASESWTASKALLSTIYDEAITAARGDICLLSRSNWDGRSWNYVDGKRSMTLGLPETGRVLVVGAGKAAAHVAAGVEALLGDRIDGGCIVVKNGHTVPLRRIEVIEAGHPIPDTASSRGASTILDLVGDLSCDDRAIVIVTGGASSLLVSPRPGIALGDKIVVNDVLLRSGASIEEMNVVRSALSTIKGGGLGRAISPARYITLLISDVPSGDLSLIGSGPTFERERAHPSALEIIRRYAIERHLPAHVVTILQHETDPAYAPHHNSEVILLADSRSALAGARRRATNLGLTVEVHDPSMAGGNHEAAVRFAERLKVIAAERASGLRQGTTLLSAGETVLKVHGSGMGGRNQEFALVAAIELAGTENAHMLASGTDGTDGPTDASGAFVSGATVARGLASNRTASKDLEDQDSHRFFSAIDDLHRPGPTGTNVMDLVIGLVW